MGWALQDCCRRCSCGLLTRRGSNIIPL
jgi:hypothetical protein